MGIIKTKITKSLLIERGKTYDTKNLQGLFLVNEITVNKKGEQTIAWGTYLKDNMENCPIGVDRLITGKVVVEEKEVCDRCSFPLDKKYTDNSVNF
jgi:hypothetical protein